MNGIERKYELRWRIGRLWRKIEIKSRLAFWPFKPLEVKSNPEIMSENEITLSGYSRCIWNKGWAIWCSKVEISWSWITLLIDGSYLLKWITRTICWEKEDSCWIVWIRVRRVVMDEGME